MNKLALVLLAIILSIASLFAQKHNTIVENNNDFAFRFFQKISSQDSSSVFISPISVSSALSMTYDGAKGRTAKEMRKTLGFTKDKASSHKEFTDLLKYYTNSDIEIFKIVNAAFAQEKYKFLESYFDLLKDYNAIIKQADFIDDINREKARNEINNWVLENTNYKIKELIDKNSVDKLTRLILLNAIHFKANWKYKFPEEKTRQMIFHHPARQYIAQFMHIKQDFNYYKDSIFTFVEIPYDDDLASMFILFPTDSCDIDEFITNITYNKFKSIHELSKKEKIDLLIPKFKIETKYKLKKPLIEMGIIKAFTNSANFKGMNGRSDLMIDDVIHQAFIEIDENGTEAAAATAVVVRAKSLPNVYYVNLNRPFVFIIKENYMNSVLFMGKFMNPEE